MWANRAHYWANRARHGHLWPSSAGDNNRPHERRSFPFALYPKPSVCFPSFHAFVFETPRDADFGGKGPGQLHAALTPMRSEQKIEEQPLLRPEYMRAR